MGISGYTLVDSDPPSNKRGGACFFYKSFRPSRILNVHYLQESICFELKIGGKTFYLSTDAQAKVQMALKLTENLELNLENLVQRNLFLVVAMGDFSAKSSNWFCQDN